MMLQAFFIVLFLEQEYSLPFFKNSGLSFYDLQKFSSIEPLVSSVELLISSLEPYVSSLEQVISSLED